MIILCWFGLILFLFRQDQQDLLDFLFRFPVSTCPPSRAAQARRAGMKLKKLNPPPAGSFGSVLNLQCSLLISLSCA
jgi:hypothetical protein